MVLRNKAPLVAIGLLLVTVFVLIGATAGPFINGRTSTNSCEGCHSDRYELYIDVPSTSVPAEVSNAPTTVGCNVSITSNAHLKTAYERTWYSYTLTVTATSLNGNIDFVTSSISYTNQNPDQTYWVNFTAMANANATDTIRFAAWLLPDHNPEPGGDNTTRVERADTFTNTWAYCAPILSGGIVTPGSGTVDTDYHFEVMYRDDEGDLPRSIECIINGDPYSMTVKDGTADTILTGEVYRYVTNGTYIGWGINSFRFNASDNKIPARGDLGLKSGPDVEMPEFPPIVNINYPIEGATVGGILNISGNASDPNPDDTITIVEVTTNYPNWNTATGTDEWYYHVNLSAIADDTLVKIVARARSDGNSSMPEVNIIVNNSLVNTKPIINFDLITGTKVNEQVWLNGTVIDPELYAQTIKVDVGIGGVPTMSANVSNNGSSCTWSILMDLTLWGPGNVQITAVAYDDYESSLQASIIVDVVKGNLPPILSPDPVGTIWGTYNFTGTVNDLDGDVLDTEYSLDNSTWADVLSNGTDWWILIDVTSLGEGNHTIYLRTDDGEAVVCSSIIFTAMEPSGEPIITSTSPANPYTTTPGEKVDFLIDFRAGDSNGVIIEWLLDGSTSIPATTDDDSSSISYTFNDVGSYTISVVVTNAGESTLKASTQWIVNVAAALSIQAKGNTSVSTATGTGVLLEFTTITGTANTVAWTLDGNAQINTGHYFSYIPDTAGTYTIVVTVTDAYSNQATVTWTVTVTDPVDPGTSVSSSGSGAQGVDPMGAVCIGSVGLLLVLVILGLIIMVGATKVRSMNRIKPSIEVGPEDEPEGSYEEETDMDEGYQDDHEYQGNDEYDDPPPPDGDVDWDDRSFNEYYDHEYDETQDDMDLFEPAIEDLGPDEEEDPPPADEEETEILF